MNKQDTEQRYKKLAKLERRMLRYHFPDKQSETEPDGPDGSFMMGVFQDGYEAGQRDAKKSSTSKGKVKL